MTRCVVTGTGAREHALAWTLAAEADVALAPGNAGAAAQGIMCVDTPLDDLAADLVVIGPDATVVDGLADRLRARGVAVVAPGADGARLEGSKAYLKEFLVASGVPTAAYASFEDYVAAEQHLKSMSPPYVIKTDGLAAGKGVLVTTDLEIALDDVAHKLAGLTFGNAGRTVVIEEALRGEECSLFVLCDGTDAVALAPSRDFKRVGDGNVGPNTGGMGAYAPLPEMGEAQVSVVMDRVIAPTVAELRRRGIDYRGVLYAGLMLTAQGPKLLEYNVRFGDPETQVVAPLYRGRLLDLLVATAGGSLAGVRPTPSGAAVTVVLASRGYPDRPVGGDEISGLGPDGQLATPRSGTVVFHAGTRREGGRWLTTGGRALSVTGVAETVEAARVAAYDAAATVTFEGMVVRGDVAGAGGR
ncbi:MAG TPA: phosphoribosylamine--glycine ligase [Acidimicrobiales bacterium]|nr:phosphoribosylamine--glycine ligase [Acidimicrobiales bacterium]